MRARFTVAAAILALATALLGGLAAWPIYRDGRVWLVVAVSAAVAFGTVWLARRRRWGAFGLVLLIVAFVVLVVPLAVPSALGGGAPGILRGLGDGLAAVALGWKQLLTLTLPVGAYQTVLVPLMVTMFAAVASATLLAVRGGRTAVFAALPVLAPVLFGTIFGSSTVSEPMAAGPLRIAAPRELALWLAASAVVAVWIAWTAGIGRRSALRLGRRGGGPGRSRANAWARGAAGAGIVACALAVGAAAAPALDGGSRTVPRDRVDPELVVRHQTSPLAGYRTWKRDAAFDAELFAVASDGPLPHRLRIAVLDRYDGVDFSLGDENETGRFARFPSGEPLAESTRLSVRIGEGYRGVWVPLAMPLAGPPSFGGDRAGELSDGFYVNRDTWSAVAVPTERGLRDGDRYEADVSLADDPALDDAPAHRTPLIDLETMPQLARWLETQALPADGGGLREAVDRLRERGYLSHSLTDGEGEREWLSELNDAYGTRFATSPGGHSIARIEDLFEQLNDQQLAAGERAPEKLLVAGIGDDEQFATAAALIAMADGYDARVVVGMRLGGEEDGVPGVPACSASCTGRNVAAWVEARGADGVWAPLDVTPQVEIPPTTLEEGEQLPEYPTIPEERDAAESDPSIGTSESDPGSSQDRPGDEMALLWSILRVVLLSLAALVLIALLFLFIPVVKRIRRRRRRRAPEPETRALGAWHELIDARTDDGVRVPAGADRRTIALALDVPAARWAAWTADRAVFSREGIDGDDADELWRVVDEATAERRAAMGPWERIRARYSLASFGITRTTARGRRPRGAARDQARPRKATR